MAFGNSNPAEIMQAVLRFYRSRLTLPDRSVYACVEPMNPPAAPPGGDFWIACGFDDGSFPFDEQDDEQLREEFEIRVFGFTRMQLDASGREDRFLFDATRGAIAIKKKLLLIVGEELTTPDGETGILASRVKAHRSYRPSYDPAQGVGWTGVSFGFDFDWELPGAEDGGDD